MDFTKSVNKIKQPCYTLPTDEASRFLPPLFIGPNHEAIDMAQLPSYNL